MPSSGPDDVRTLGELHLLAASRLHEVFSAAAATQGLTFMEGRALRLIAVQAAQHQLIDVLAADPSRVSALVAQLVARDLVRREQARGDRRHRVVVLTPAGRRALDAIGSYLEQHSPLVSALTAREAAQLERLLRKVVAA
ncbi:MAG: MarR family transcriptional regulator [Ilumatobacteraceae bacterium]